jgi:hypothetical protein
MNSKDLLFVFLALAEELHVLGAQLILCSKSAELLELVKSNLIKVLFFQLKVFSSCL